MNLIPRFFDVTEGSITIDGVDIRDMKQHELREMIGYVPQKGMLFSGDIKSNIAYGAEDKSFENIKRAAEVAQAEDFIMEKEEASMRRLHRAAPMCREVRSRDFP